MRSAGLTVLLAVGSAGRPPLQVRREEGTLWDWAFDGVMMLVDVMWRSHFRVSKDFDIEYRIFRAWEWYNVILCCKIAAGLPLETEWLQRDFMQEDWN